MPERRVVGSGRRTGDSKEASPPKESPVAPPETTTPPKQRAEVEPDRRHPLHRKVGGKKQKAA